MAWSRLVCVAAWILAAAVQLLLFAQRPESVVVLGHDVTHETTMLQLQGLVFIACGLILGIGGYIWKRWSSLLVTASSLLYLLHWFPFRSVYKYGLAAPFNAKFVVGTSPGLRLTFITRDIVLPIAFVVAIVFVVLQIRRRKSSPG